MSKFEDLKKARKAVNLLVRLERKYPRQENEPPILPYIDINEMVALDLAIEDERPPRKHKKNAKS